MNGAGTSSSSSHNKYIEDNAHDKLKEWWYYQQQNILDGMK